MFSGKIENCITFLKQIPLVQKNTEAIAKIESFRDIGWNIEFCQRIKEEFYKTPERILTQVIQECQMKDADFSLEQRKAFMNYLSCFVTLVDKYAK